METVHTRTRRSVAKASKESALVRELSTELEVCLSQFEQEFALVRELSTEIEACRSQLEQVARLALGREVFIMRGNPLRGAATGPGFGREVRAIVRTISGENVECELLEDDPHAVCDPKKAGETGWWSLSSVVPVGARR